MHLDEQRAAALAKAVDGLDARAQALAEVAHLLLRGILAEHQELIPVKAAGCADRAHDAPDLVCDAAEQFVASLLAVTAQEPVNGADADEDRDEIAMAEPVLIEVLREQEQQSLDIGESRHAVDKEGLVRLLLHMSQCLRRDEVTHEARDIPLHVVDRPLRCEDIALHAARQALPRHVADCDALLEHIVLIALKRLGMDVPVQKLAMSRRFILMKRQ